MHPVSLHGSVRYCKNSRRCARGGSNHSDCCGWRFRNKVGFVRTALSGAGSLASATVGSDGVFAYGIHRFDHKTSSCTDAAEGGRQQRWQNRRARFQGGLQHWGILFLGTDRRCARSGSRFRAVLCSQLPGVDARGAYEPSARRGFSRIRRSAGGYRSGTTLRRTRRSPVDGPPGVPNLERPRRQDADSYRPGARRRRRHSRLLGGLATAMAGGA